MVVISHDRYFLERTTDRVYALLGDRALRMLPRGVDEYLERRQAMEQAAADAAAKQAAAPKADKQRSSGDIRAAKKELQRIERQLDKIGDKEKALHARIAEHATDFAKVAELDAELRSLSEDREDLEMRWLELADDAGE
jgi:ATP-binding cassette subfamily F protein uup